jgi:hypothetical protein
MPAPRHRISALAQLVEPETGPLYFFSLQLREEGGASNCLPTLVSACRHHLRAFPDQLSHFEEVLHRAGYSDILEADYAKLRLRIVEQGIFLVAGRFPRVIPDSFPQGLPEGVGEISYEIDLSGFLDCLVGRRPETVAGQLRALAAQSTGT